MQGSDQVTKMAGQLPGPQMSTQDLAIVERGNASMLCMNLQPSSSSHRVCAHRGVVDVGDLPSLGAELVDEDGVLQPAERQRPVASNVPGVDGSCHKAARSARQAAVKAADCISDEQAWLS